MAFETTATVLGAPISYRLHPDAKDIHCAIMDLQKQTEAIIN